jgi:Ca-activated chloride channel family protein
VATSPLVLTMLRSEASGWPARQASWKSLLAEAEGQRALATTDIDVDAAGLLSLWALTGSSTQRLLGVTSRLAVPLLGDESAAELVAAGEVDAIPSSEQDVIAANRSAPDDERVVAVYDARVRSSLDYPLTTVTNDDADRAPVVSRAAEVLQTALLDPATQDLMAAAGLRTPDGVLAGPYGERQGVVPDAETGDRLPSVETMRALSSAWATVGRRSRLLVLVDRSGSMAATLPDSTDTRADLAQRSLRQAIGSFAPDSDVGLWSFTTGLPGGDWEVLVPTGPMASSVGGTTRRETLLNAVDGLDPKIGGGTPLYDAVQAGYREAQADFAYGRLNALIVITDGRNEDAQSVSLTRLLDALRLEFDGVRPVRIIAIGYGEQADTANLRRITDITGGRTYEALTADEVESAFAQVLADL